MLCAVAGSPPPPEEAEAWIALAVRLARTGNVRRFQLYGKARPASEDPLAEALSASYLESRADSLRAALGRKAAIPLWCRSRCSREGRCCDGGPFFGIFVGIGEEYGFDLLP
jgi:hypothetical protein